MSEQKKCARCGEQAETYNFEADSTFWGLMVTDIKTTVERRLRVASHYFRRNPPEGSSPMLVSDETRPLCGDCWGLLVGRFLQGRAIPAMPGKEGR